MPPDPDGLVKEIARLKKRLEREQAIRLEAEAIAEKGLRDLYQRQLELQTLERIAARANEDRSIQDVLQFSLEEFCRFHDWKAGHGYLVRQDHMGTMLYPAGIWYAIPAEAFKPFRRVSQHSEFEKGTGLPGRACQTGKPVWIDDISQDINFPRLGVGYACGVRSAVSFPVLSGTDVVAVLEFFDTELRQPSEGLIEMMAQAGTQLGRVIERHHAQNTLRTHARELAKARDEAEAADRAKSAFLASMSHELRTPLNAIIGFSEVMQHEIAGPLSVRYKNYVADIRRCGMHLKNIINDVLDLSKVAMGALELRMGLTSVAAILENCRRIVQPMANAGEISLRVVVPPGLPYLMADETRLQQALLNLLSNAIKFTPAHGSVSVETQLQADGTLTIAIVDTGIGMTPEEVALALQPFRQVDSSLGRRYEGTGLGLPLAKAFIELHGGVLNIESVPKAGTRIVMRIPASRSVSKVA